MLERGFDILIALRDHPDGMVLKEIVQSTGLPFSTAHRLIKIVVDNGFAAFDKSTKRYTLGVRIFELANQVRSVRSFSQISRPQMQKLADRTGETVQLAILSDGSAMFLEKVGADRSITIRGSVGQREPLWATSSGKVLLASLDAVERDKLIDQLELTSHTEYTLTSKKKLLAAVENAEREGWAMADGEYDRDVRAIAVPIYNSEGRVVAALNVAGPKFRLPHDLLQSWLPDLKETAHIIGVQLPASPIDLGTKI